MAKNHECIQDSRITEIRVHNAKMDEKLDNIERRTESIEKKMDDWIQSAEKKFASKNVEKVVYGSGALIAAALVGFAIWGLQKLIENGGLR